MNSKPGFADYRITNKATNQRWHIITDAEMAAFDEAASVIDVIASENDADAPVEYFDLQGRRVDNPATGIYIRRDQGGNSLRE